MKPASSFKKSAKNALVFGRKKKLGYRTPDRFKRLTFRKKPVMTARPRSFGGHR
jgi:hypothetical protein